MGDYWKGRDKQNGVWKVEVLFPINKIATWLKKRKELKKKIEYEWVYDGCGCMPPEGGRSDPYCHEHYNPLTRIPHEV